MADNVPQGLRTAVYFVDDLPAATKWYSDFLGFAPYYDTPYYVGFNVGGYELGLHPREGGGEGPGGVETYWGVADIGAAHDRLLSHGATAFKAIQDVGEGIMIASVQDPWGNVFGIIENPHFKLPE